MILAAGRGRRMQAHSSILPKPLVNIGGQPLIDYSLSLLKNAEINDAIVNIHHLGEQIAAHLADKPFNFTISREEELLETGGGICRALPLLEDSFFTLNSDVICIEKNGKSILQKMNKAWDSNKMDCLMLLCPVEKAIGYEGDGDFSLSKDGRIQAKQDGEIAYVYMGVQRLNKRFLNGAPSGAFSLSQLYKSALNKGDNCPIYGMVNDGTWLHVGDPEGVKLAENYFIQAAAASPELA